MKPTEAAEAEFYTPDASIHPNTEVVDSTPTDTEVKACVVQPLQYSNNKDDDDFLNGSCNDNTIIISAILSLL